MTLLAELSGLRTKILKGLNATLTFEPRLKRQLTADVDETHQLMRRFLFNLRSEQSAEVGARFPKPTSAR
jgi:hypothetical protein